MSWIFDELYSVNFARELILWLQVGNTETRLSVYFPILQIYGTESFITSSITGY